MHESTRVTDPEGTGHPGRRPWWFARFRRHVGHPRASEEPPVPLPGVMAIDVAAELSGRTYEGPFDLLLRLILAEEVDIHEVSLARIVDAYLAEVELLVDRALDLDIATEFLLIAATLVELKARRLLPSPAPLDLDDELALWEERDVLLARLLECKTFKDVSRLFGTLADEAGRSFPRPSDPTSASPGWRPIRWPGSIR